MRYYVGAEESKWQRTGAISRRAAGVADQGTRYPAGQIHAVPNDAEVALCGRESLSLFRNWDFEATSGDKCPDCLGKA